MYHVHCEENLNLVKTGFSGHVTLDEAKQWRAAFDVTLKQASPGFRLLTDLSTLQEMDLDCVDEIRAAMEEIREHGVSQIVRVIPDHWKDIGFSTMSRFHYDPSVSIQTVDTMAEARKLLGA